MREIQPPELIDLRNEVSIFLAGSIEMGKAKDWQQTMIDSLNTWDVTIFNPRREDWDSSWEQKITDQQFYEQVNWELDHIERSNVVVFYFDPDTKSPITLMELGAAAALKPEQCIVCCPEGFWRKGNVDIVCERYGVKQVHDLDQLVSILKSVLYTRHPGTIV